jgi:2-hydroxychromene-2-carboxylate isomerase
VSATKLQFYFDFISPYAYLAWTQVRDLAARHGREVEPAPVLFAALLNANGQKGPAEIPDKRAYLFKDCFRTAHRLGVPFAPPPSHPFNPLVALRVASLELDGPTRAHVIDALFSAVWSGGPGAETSPIVAAVLSRAGLSGADLAAAATTQPAKDALRRTTDAALARGVFGVPTMVVDEELFWGFDSFANLEVVLDGNDPLRAEDVAAWQAVKPSATR